MRKGGLWGVALVVLASAVAMGAGCGGSGLRETCTPGTTRDCSCPGGGLGEQACLADGTAWGECDCGGSGTGGSAGGDADASGGRAGGDPGAGGIGVMRDCAPEIAAKADAYHTTVEYLVDAAAEIRAELAVACFSIASDLGDDSVSYPGDGRDIDDDTMAALCDAASGAIEAEIEAGGSVTVDSAPPRCQVDAGAQLDCEADCSMDPSCEGGTIEARCEPGELRVTCEGPCTGTLSCEGSPELAVPCQGSCASECTGICEGTCSGACDGTCEGSCDGTCQAVGSNGECAGGCAGVCRGTCVGECSGTCVGICTGQCAGSCEYTAAAEIECNEDATCKGGCDGMATAPRCEAELEPPACDIDAECQAACDGQAKFLADCVPPAVAVTGSSNAAFAATLEAHLPTLIAVMAKLELIGSAAADVAQGGQDVGGEITGSIGCAADYGAEFVAQLQAAAMASVSISVSVEADATVLGAASSG